MAFVDFYAAGGTPTRPALAPSRQTPRAAPRPPARTSGHRGWRALLKGIIALGIIAVPGVIAANFFDDALLGALSAALLFAAVAPMAAWLGNDRGSRRWTSY